MERKRLAAAAVFFGLLALAAAFYVFEVEPNELEVSRYEIRAGGADARIAVFSDLHASSERDSRRLMRVAEEINELDADYVVIAGDVIDSSSEEIGFLEHLGAIEDRNNTFVVLGNHDYSWGWGDVRYYARDWSNKDAADKVAAWFQEHGFTVLRNQNVKRGGICFIGVDDLWSGEQDLGAAYDGAVENCTTVLLTHNPDTLLRLDGRETDLVIAGHTHGGQVCPPLIEEAPWIPAELRQRCGRGIYRIENTTLFITRGVGAAPRLNSKPEIAVLELT